MSTKIFLSLGLLLIIFSNLTLSQLCVTDDNHVCNGSFEESFNNNYPERLVIKPNQLFGSQPDSLAYETEILRLLNSNTNRGTQYPYNYWQFEGDWVHLNFGSPDIFSDDATYDWVKTPRLYDGDMYQFPHAVGGDRYVGLYYKLQNNPTPTNGYVEWTEYLGQKLLRPMEAGKTYWCSMKISAGYRVINESEDVDSLDIESVYPELGLKDIGMYFTDEPIILQQANSYQIPYNVVDDGTDDERSHLVLFENFSRTDSTYFDMHSVDDFRPFIMETAVGKKNNFEGSVRNNTRDHWMEISGYVVPKYDLDFIHIGLWNDIQGGDVFHRDDAQTLTSTDLSSIGKFGDYLNTTQEIYYFIDSVRVIEIDTCCLEEVTAGLFNISVIEYDDLSEYNSNQCCYKISFAPMSCDTDSLALFEDGTFIKSYSNPFDTLTSGFVNDTICVSTKDTFDFDLSYFYDGDTVCTLNSNIAGCENIDCSDDRFRSRIKITSQKIDSCSSDYCCYDLFMDINGYNNINLSNINLMATGDTSAFSFNVDQSRLNKSVSPNGKNFILTPKPGMESYPNGYLFYLGTVCVDNDELNIIEFDNIITILDDLIPCPITGTTSLEFTCSPNPVNCCDNISYNLESVFYEYGDLNLGQLGSTGYYCNRYTFDFTNSPSCNEPSKVNIYLKDQDSTNYIYNSEMSFDEVSDPYYFEECYSCRDVKFEFIMEADSVNCIYADTCIVEVSPPCDSLKNEIQAKITIENKETQERSGIEFIYKNDKITLDGLLKDRDYYYYLYDVNARIVLNGALENNEILINGLNESLYILVISDGNENYVYKFIKNR